MNNRLPAFLLEPENLTSAHKWTKHNKLPFIDHTIASIASFIKTGYLQIEMAGKKGFLQQIHPGIKLLFLLYFVVIINISSHITTQLLVCGFLILLYLLSRIHLIAIFKKITFLGLMFGFLIILPAALNIVTPGKCVIRLFDFGTAHHFWIYNIPPTIGITAEGCTVVFRFFLKVSNAIALTLLIVYSTPFNEIIRSLKILRVPDVFLLIVTLSYKFIFILSQTTEETYLALKSRWWKYSGKNETNTLIAGRITHIFRKSWVKYEEIYKAMVVRGFTGKVVVLSFIKITGMDIVFCAFFVFWGIICCII